MLASFIQTLCLTISRPLCCCFACSDLCSKETNRITTLISYFSFLPHCIQQHHGLVVQNIQFFIGPHHLWIINHLNYLHGLICPRVNKKCGGVTFLFIAQCGMFWIFCGFLIKFPPCDGQHSMFIWIADPCILNKFFIILHRVNKSEDKLTFFIDKRESGVFCYHHNHHGATTTREEQYCRGPKTSLLTHH